MDSLINKLLSDYGALGLFITFVVLLLGIQSKAAKERETKMADQYAALFQAHIDAMHKRMDERIKNSEAMMNSAASLQTVGDAVKQLINKSDERERELVVVVGHLNSVVQNLNVLLQRVLMKE